MIDMTRGKTVNLILRFASPILFSGIFQQMYSIADTIIVGKFIGEEALAGVGSTTTIIFLLFSIVTGMCSGAGVVIAQCFGNRNYEKTRQAVTSLIYIMAILTILVSVVGNLRHQCLYDCRFYRIGGENCFRLSAFRLYRCYRYLDCNPALMGMWMHYTGYEVLHRQMDDKKVRIVQDCKSLISISF